VYIILQLLARRQSPESIRNIDFRRPVRKDLLSGDAARIDYEQADITNEESIRAAFGKKWPASVANLPLSIFHTAAIIIPQDRKKAIYSLVREVKNIATAPGSAARE
jgi:predicted RNA methylase